jgi:hypothetical protein
VYPSHAWHAASIPQVVVHRIVEGNAGIAVMVVGQHSVLIEWLTKSESALATTSRGSHDGGVVLMAHANWPSDNKETAKTVTINTSLQDMAVSSHLFDRKIPSRVLPKIVASRASRHL